MDGQARMFLLPRPQTGGPASSRVSLFTPCEISILTAATGLLTDPVRGELLPTWQAAIAEMRSAVECWEKAQRSDLVLLPNEGGIGKTRLAAELFKGSLPEATSVYRDLNAVMQPPEPIQVTHLWNTHPDQDHLSNLDSLASKINPNISHVRTVVIIDGLDGLTLRPMPTNLLEAMWLQLGQAIAADKSFRKCRQCGIWFELTPKAARTDKVFYSGACKAKAYRQRLAMRDHSGQESGPGVGVPEPGERTTK